VPAIETRCRDRQRRTWVDGSARENGVPRSGTSTGQALGRRVPAVALGVLLATPGLAAVLALSPAAQAVPLPTPIRSETAAAAGDRWQAPLPGRMQVARRFQPPASRYGAGHRGVDLRTGAAAEVLSAGDGVVSFAGSIAGRGVVVVVTGELRTTYEPVAAGVRRGDRVRRGQQLGRLTAEHPGCPAGAAGTCLHWGLLHGERYLDPLSLLHPVPVRLLPLTGSGNSRVTDGAPVAPLPRATSPAVASTGHSPMPMRVPTRVPAGAAVVVGLTVVGAAGVHAAGIRAARRSSRGPPFATAQDVGASVQRVK